MPADPIAPVVSAHSVLVVPNPVPPMNAPYPPPSAWESKIATNGQLFVPVHTLMTLLFTISPDMNTVGKGINKALKDVAKVVTAIADNLHTIGNLSDVASVMTALQNGLSLAQTLAPGGASTALSSASGLFQQLQSLLANVSTVDQAAAELAELSQQLIALSMLFPN